MPRSSIARSAALLAGLTALSQALGFLRDVVIAATFGAGARLDAYLVAQGLMNLVLGFVAGALAKSVVPTVARRVAAGRRAEASRTVRTAVTACCLVLGVVGVLAGVFAETLVQLLAPGFDGDTAATAVLLTRVVLLATVPIALTNLLAAVAQAHGRFFSSGVQGVPFNLVMILFAVSLGPGLGPLALALGFVVGSVARLLVQLPDMRSLGVGWRPSLAWRDPGFREMTRLLPPLLVGSALTNVNTLVDRAVGSTLQEGTIASLSFAWRLIALSDALLVVAVASAFYPAFARAAGTAELRALVDRSLTALLVTLAPVAVVLGVGSAPVVEAVYGRGAFDAGAVQTTAMATALFAPCVLAIGLREIAVRACLAVGDARTPVATSVLGMVVNVVGDLLLAPVLGIAGLALATSASITLSSVALLVMVHHRHRALSPGVVAARAGRVAVASAVAAAAVVAVQQALGPPSGASAALGHTVAVVAAACLAYTVVLAALRGPEVAELRSALRRAGRRR